MARSVSNWEYFTLLAAHLVGAAGRVLALAHRDRTPEEGATAAAEGAALDSLLAAAGITSIDLMKITPVHHGHTRSGWRPASN